MNNANHDLIHLRQPNVLPFSASWSCYLGNLGLIECHLECPSEAALISV